VGDSLKGSHLSTFGGNPVTAIAVLATIDVIEKSCLRMDRIIKNIGHITQYRTKPYIEAKRILDIDESSSDPGSVEGTEPPVA
jgi:4-aminobutyrate aminotransferase-like enzyme